MKKDSEAVVLRLKSDKKFAIAYLEQTLDMISEDQRAAAKMLKDYLKSLTEETQ